ncbi:MAG: MvaI/BcnI family restriction endonuclease [Alloprevotella sp.]
MEVENAIHDNKEYFRYKQIEHTRNPNVWQFDVLLEQNLITVDLLLCRPGGHGDTYSFKIKNKGMPLLFPESIIYNI